MTSSSRGLVPRSLFNSPYFRLTNFPNVWNDLENELETLSFSDPTGISLYEDKDGKNVVVEAALPGLKIDDIEVSLEDNGTLLIKGEKKTEEEDKTKKHYRKATSSFFYRISLPTQVDQNQEPKATYTDGVMKISFQKTKQNQLKKISVKKG